MENALAPNILYRKEGWNGNESHSDVQWTFPGSLFFAIISITTIGYGDQTPKTLWGKVVAVLYVIVGMPLLLLFEISLFLQYQINFPFDNSQRGF